MARRPLSLSRLVKSPMQREDRRWRQRRQCELLRPYALVWLPPGAGRAWMIGCEVHTGLKGLSRLLSQHSVWTANRLGQHATPGQLWCCCNTLTILKESLTAERIAWFATQRIQRIGGLP
jgi:hypothetical protein